MLAPLPIYSIVFYSFAALLIIAATLVIVAKNPVRSVLSLVLCFFASSVLWMMLKAEFLSLVLLFVYVGAVMTLFLFVVMMLNIETVSQRDGFARYLPYGLIAIAVLLGLIFFAIGPERLNLTDSLPIINDKASNTQALGQLLFTDYIYPFEIAGVILLVAIVAAISLAFYGRKPDAKSQLISRQHAVTKAQRLRIINKVKHHD